MLRAMYDWPYVLVVVLLVWPLVSDAIFTNAFAGMGGGWQILMLVGLTLIPVVWGADRTKGRYYFGMPKLLRAGPWQCASVRLLSPYRWAVPEIPLLVTMGDGSEIRYRLVYPTFDLVGHIEQTGTIWFAGSPHAGGKPVALGVPGLPILCVGVADPS